MATIYDAGISTKTTGALSQITGWTEVSPQVEIYDNDFIFSIATAGTAEFTTSAINIAGYYNIVLNVTEWYLPQDTLDDVVVYYSIDGGGYTELYHAPRVDSFVARTYSIPETGSTIRFKVTNLDNAAIGAEYKISSFTITGENLIEFNSQPSTSIMQSAYRAIRYGITSNSSTVAKVQCEVYFNGTLKKTIIHDPEIGTTDTFAFDVSSIIRDNLSFYSPFTLPFSHYVAESAYTSCYVHCVFNAVVLSGGVLSVDSNDLTSNTSYACNAALQYEDSDLSAYFVDSSAKKFMTDATNNIRIHRGQSFRLSFITSLTSVKSRLIQYNGTSVISTDYVSASIDTNVKRGQISINTTYMDTSCDSFTIVLTNSANAVMSETRTFRIVDAICEDDKQIWFLNKYGDFDTFNFTGEFIEGLTVSAKDFKKALPYNFSIGNRGVQTFRVDAFDKFKTSSRPLNREEYRWLKQIKTTIEGFLQEGTNMIPIVFLGRENYKIEGNNIGTPIEVEYIKANDIVTQ